MARPRENSFQVARTGMQTLSALLDICAVALLIWQSWVMPSGYLVTIWCASMMGLLSLRFLSLTAVSTFASGRMAALGTQASALFEIASNFGWLALGVLMLKTSAVSPSLLVLSLGLVLTGRVLLELQAPSKRLILFFVISGLPSVAVLLFTNDLEAVAAGMVLLALCWTADRLVVHYRKDNDQVASTGLLYLDARQEAAGQVLRATVAEETLKDILDCLPYGISVCNSDLHFTHWNENFLHMMNITPDWMSANRTLRDLVYYHAEQGEFVEDDPEMAYRQRVEQFRSAQNSGICEDEVLRPSGAIINIRCVRLAGERVMSIYTDISKNRKVTTDALVHLYQHDALTGLPNRVKFRRDLEKAVGQASRNGSLVSVMMLDLYQFKDINDTLGYPVGDEILCTVARRLAACARKTDIVARLGGDEFAIIGNDCKSIENVMLAAQLVISTLVEPVILDGNVINIAINIGITVYPNDRDNTDQLVRNAEMALYRAKQEGGNSFQLYDRSMHQAMQARTEMEHDIRKAIEDDDLVFHYQPQIDLKTRQVIGVEALMRWHHPKRGWVAPDQFIPIAEESRLIIPLTEKILPRACLEAQSLHARGFTSLTVAVNLSPMHFKTDDLPKFISGVLDDTGLKPEFLELEITEGMVMHDSEAVIGTLNQLDQLGVKLSIDDFGTGYSSLSYLKRFPVDKLKIDKSFVHDIPNDPGASAIVQAVIKLGHSFNLKVIAEGVETQEQIDFLEAMGCDEVQGWYYSKALPITELISWLEERESGPIPLMGKCR